MRAAGLPLRMIAGFLPQNANSRGDQWSLPLLERGNGECRATRPQVSGPTANIWSLRLFEIVAMRSQPSGEDWLASSSMPDGLASRYRALRGKRFDTKHNVRSTKLFRLLFLPCSYQQVQLDRRWAGRLRWPSAEVRGLVSAYRYRCRKRSSVDGWPRLCRGLAFIDLNFIRFFHCLP